MEIEVLDSVSAFPVLDPLTFPTNEGSFTVRERIISDIRDSKKLRIVTGYAGMEELIQFISEYAFNQEIEIVIGHEPSMTMRKTMRQSPEKIVSEMREYWLNRCFSPRTNASVLEAIRAIETGRVKTRIHTERFLHAKATVTDTAATFGSSNFSRSGLEQSRELNGRYLYGEKEYGMITEYVKGCWERSEDFDERFLELLKELQLHISWEEALARACAALLEGNWAINLLPPQLRSDFHKLWPHQKQAIAQALTVLETQGSVVISDPTGSGKTRIGGWLFRLAYNRMIARGGEYSGSLIPVMVSPSSVANNWYEILDKVGLPREIISTGLLSNSKKESTQRRLSLISHTNLLGVDEIHNFYNDRTRRTKALTSNLAESRIFATATPINTGFGDLITLMRLLGTEDLDSETYSKMKSLEDKIKDPNPKIREESIKEAKGLIGRFMVRRTRDELKSLVNERPDEYRIEGRVANYPDYITEEYPIGSIEEKELISSIEDDVKRIIGISRIRKIAQTKAEVKIGISEERTLHGRLRLASATSQYQIWKTLDSSPVALFEHIMGTKEAEREYDLESGKSLKSKSVGVFEKLNRHSIPEWGLSEELRNSGSVPEWIIDKNKFEEMREKEIEVYESILEKSLRLSNHRMESKLKIIQESYKEHGKPLAFDTSIITLAYFKKKLVEKAIEVHIFSGGDGRTKKKKVEVAENLFGLKSDSGSRIGLLSDSMSEGINLQGSNVLIHLTYPTTVRKAEQRVGRVDRMDTKFEQITIYYPERDEISVKMKAHLKERSKLVSDIIGSNIKLPGMDDDIDEIADSKELEMTSSEFSQSMFTNREGLFDAFHGVRKLIGEEGIVSSEVYQMMRTSEARVVSCVGLVRSETPWCFAVIQTNKDWAPQWIHLDWSRKDARKNSGIITETDKVCKLLRNNLNAAENLEPSIHSDMVIGEYLDHLSNKEIHLIPMRRRALLKQMSDVITHWCRTKYGWGTEIGESLRFLSKAANGSKNANLDLRQLAREWVSFVKEHRERFQIDLSRSRRGSKRTVNLLKDHPPEDIEAFLERFSKVDEAEDFDSRVIALIAGIPDSDFGTFDYR